MPLWGNKDAASNSVLSAPAQVRLAPNTTNRDALYDNMTANGYGTGERIGMFGVDTAEIATTGGGVATIVLTNRGTGYSANATVTITGGGGASATANATANTSTGKIQIVNITNAGSSYETEPVVTISAPTAIIFNGNTAVSGNTIAITSANSRFQAGDRLTYAGNTTSTPGGLTDTATYFVSFANSTVLALATTPNGANIALTPASGDSSTANGATFTGVRATATSTVGGGFNNGIAHAGWVLRTEGSGGRAGRVQYETLVAMGSMTQDGSDDDVLPDA